MPTQASFERVSSVPTQPRFRKPSARGFFSMRQGESMFGARTTRDGLRMRNDCVLQSILMVMPGLDYEAVANTCMRAGAWHPYNGGYMQRCFKALGMTLVEVEQAELASVVATNGALVCRGRKGRTGHAWVMTADGKHHNGLGFEKGPVTLYKVV